MEGRERGGSGRHQLGKGVRCWSIVTMRMLNRRGAGEEREGREGGAGERNMGAGAKPECAGGQGAGS